MHAREAHDTGERHHHGEPSPGGDEKRGAECGRRESTDHGGEAREQEQRAACTAPSERAARASGIRRCSCAATDRHIARRDRRDPRDRFGDRRASRRGEFARGLGCLLGGAALGDGEVLGGLGGKPGRLLVLVQDALLGRDLAGGGLDPHRFGGLGGLSEDPQGLLQPYGVALGGEVLPTAQPARKQVRDPERRGGSHEQSSPDHVHATTLGHGGRMAGA